MSNFSTTILFLFLFLAALAAGMVAHTRHDDEVRRELRRCHDGIAEAREDRDHEHAVADACLRVVERCGVAVDELCEGGTR